MKDTDFPFFQNLFHGVSFKPDQVIGVNNGLIFPLGLSPSPKGLFLNPFPNFDQDLLSLNNNGSIFTTTTTTTQGAGSSPGPFLGLSNTSDNIHELLEPYTIVSSKGHLNTNLNSSYALPLAPPSAQNGILHGLPSAKPFWANQSFVNQAHHLPQTYSFPSSLNFKDLGSTKGLADGRIHVSCIGTADLKGQQKRAAGQRKRRRLNLMRKASKAQKKANVIKGQWTPQEDRVLVQLVGRYGIRKWSKIAKTLTGRVGKQCRERWHNHLRPDIRKDTWSEEEDRILIRAHREVGNKWAEIARRLPGRSENTIKNHWNATKRRQNSKKRNKDPNARGSLLQNYIRSLMGMGLATPTNQNDNKNNNNSNSNYNSMDDIDADENDDNNDDRPAQVQLPSENNSEVTSVDNWVVNPAINLAYHNNININGGANGAVNISLDLENDKSLYAESYGFRSFLDEMSFGAAGAMENESNVDFQMRSEIESLMKGPGEVKQEMDLMEMICQGKL